MFLLTIETIEQHFLKHHKTHKSKTIPKKPIPNNFKTNFNFGTGNWSGGRWKQKIREKVSRQLGESGRRREGHRSEGHTSEQGNSPCPLFKREQADTGEGESMGSGLAKEIQVTLRLARKRKWPNTTRFAQYQKLTENDYHRKKWKNDTTSPDRRAKNEPCLRHQRSICDHPNQKTAASPDAARREPKRRLTPP